jgi:hypothetical protein
MYGITRLHAIVLCMHILPKESQSVKHAEETHLCLRYKTLPLEERGIESALRPQPLPSPRGLLSILWFNLPSIWLDITACLAHVSPSAGAAVGIAASHSVTPTDAVHK